MVWHHEALIAYYIGVVELRHHTFIVGPKFSIFYDNYTAYEMQQLAHQWSDSCELVQGQHLRYTKEQMEYNRIDKEYEFVKKRALINFLTNSKLFAEANFHYRAVAMLNSVESFEQANLKS